MFSLNRFWGEGPFLSSQVEENQGKKKSDWWDNVYCSSGEQVLQRTHATLEVYRFLAKARFLSVGAP